MPRHAAYRLGPDHPANASHARERRPQLVCDVRAARLSERSGRSQKPAWVHSRSVAPCPLRAYPPVGNRHPCSNHSCSGSSSYRHSPRRLRDTQKGVVGVGRGGPSERTPAWQSTVGMAWGPHGSPPARSCLGQLKGSGMYPQPVSTDVDSKQTGPGAQRLSDPVSPPPRSPSRAHPAPPRKPARRRRVEARASAASGAPSTAPARRGTASSHGDDAREKPRLRVVAGVVHREVREPTRHERSPGELVKRVVVVVERIDRRWKRDRPDEPRL